MENTKKSSKILPPNYLLPLEQGAAPHSIQIGEKYYKTEDVLELALIVIDQLSRNTCSPDVLYLSFTAAARAKPDHIKDEDVWEILSLIAEKSDRSRKSNPISGMF